MIKSTQIILSIMIFSLSALATVIHAQDSTSAIPRDSMITVAKEMMSRVPYCALATTDETGEVSIRTMDPFPPEADMTVWLATNPHSRKVQHIEKNNRVVLYYSDVGANGYVSFYGTATLVNDAEEKERRWKSGWEVFYPNREDAYMLIKVVPNRVEIVSVAHGIVGAERSWTTPSISFPTSE